MRYWEKLIFVHIFLLGLAFAFLVPPLQKPDEHGHFKRAYYLSRGYVYLFNDGQKLPLDKQLDRLINDMTLNSLPNRPQNKIGFPDLNAPVFAGKDALTPIYRKEKLMFIWGPIAYIPAAAGILAARLLHLNAYLTFYSGRAAIFLFSLIALLFIYRRTGKPYRYLILFVSALPMTVHQLTAYSYDSVHYLLGFFVFSLFTDFFKPRKINLRQLAVFGAAVTGFMATKLSYEPLCLLVFLIPWNKIADNKSQYIKLVSGWMAAVIVTYFLLTWPIYLSSMTYTGNPPGVNPGQQMAFIAAHPASYFGSFTASSISLAKFHLMGVIGIFGWLDYSLDWWVYGLYVAAAVYIVFKLHLPEAGGLSKGGILMLSLILFINYAFIMTVFYLNWKPVGSAVIDGTQGRYFTVFVPFLMYLLVQLRIKLYRK